jgi:hypothetical protein
MLYNYPTLFNKYILNISNINKQIEYNLMKKNNLTEYICHLHIHDICTFSEYIEYINIIINEFSIIITYNNGDLIENHLGYNILFIKVENKGYDIGPKVSMLKYLENESISYKYILFLHSKSSITHRNKYFNPFLKNSNRIKLIKYLLINSNLLGIFPNEIHINEESCYTANIRYFNEIIKFLDINNNQKIFAEGNCMILHKNVIDFIFKSRYELFYNILNDNKSFDYNWFNICYNLKSNSNKSYKYFIDNNLNRNNLKIELIISYLFPKLIR